MLDQPAEDTVGVVAAELDAVGVGWQESSHMQTTTVQRVSPAPGMHAELLLLLHEVMDHLHAKRLQPLQLARQWVAQDLTGVHQVYRVDALAAVDGENAGDELLPLGFETTTLPD